MSRYAIDADGSAYVDVARAYLRGDWKHAFSSYWSPLYTWLAAAVLGVFRPSFRWEIPLLHLIALAGFILCFLAWEWLTSEWEHWKGPPAHPLLTDIAGYCVLLWAGLRLTGLGFFANADVFVMALFIATIAILVRVRRGVARQRDLVALGLLLGTGFLAKTAFLAVIPVSFVVLGALLRSWFNRPILTVALVAAALSVPYVAAISISEGRFTVGDSGWLNYSWHVTGISVEGYRNGAYRPGPDIRHPVRVLLEHPLVVSFEQHLFGSLPIHADPSWWCEGYPAKFNRARQLMILWSNIRFSIYAFRCPALLLFLVGLPFGAVMMTRSLAEMWFMWAPAVFLALTYCFVYSDYRYLAGCYAVIGFCLIAATWGIPLPRSIIRGSIWAIPLFAALFCMGTGFRHMLPDLLGDLTGKTIPAGYSSVKAAEKAIQAGLRPGDRVAYIGFSLAAAHVGLERAHIVTSVPETYTNDDRTIGRPMSFTFPNPDAFWRSSPHDQEKTFDAFRSVGAKWVFADTVPKSADITGWQVAAQFDKRIAESRPTDRPFMYFRKLE